MKSKMMVKNLWKPWALVISKRIIFFVLILWPLIHSCAGSGKKTAASASEEIIGYKTDKTKSPLKQQSQKNRGTTHITPSNSIKYAHSELANLSGYEILYQGKRADLGRLVRQIALKIQAQNLYYNSKKLTDCSGIFHRVLAEMQRICSNYDYPSPTQYRSSRSLARWYYEKGALIPVNDPVKMANLIKPGAVMFFAHRDKNLDRFAGKRFFNANIVSHIGIVVAVEKDPAGKVVSYQLFHGRSRGKIASITKHHYRNPSKKSLPPFGNYSQPWIAVARLVGPKTLSSNK